MLDDKCRRNDKIRNHRFVKSPVIIWFRQESSADVKTMWNDPGEQVI